MQNKEIEKSEKSKDATELAKIDISKDEVEVTYRNSQLVFNVIISYSYSIGITVNTDSMQPFFELFEHTIDLSIGNDSSVARTVTLRNSLILSKPNSLAMLNALNSCNCVRMEVVLDCCCVTNVDSRNAKESITIANINKAFKNDGNIFAIWFDVILRSINYLNVVNFVKLTKRSISVVSTDKEFNL